MTSVEGAPQLSSASSKLNPEVSEQKDFEEEPAKRQQLDDETETVHDVLIRNWLSTQEDAAKSPATEAEQQAFEALLKEAPKDESMIPSVDILEDQTGQYEEIRGMCMKFACQHERMYIVEESSGKLLFTVNNQKSLTCAVGENWNSVVVYGYSKDLGLSKSEPVELEDDEDMADAPDFDLACEADEMCSKRESKIVTLDKVSIKIERGTETVKISVDNQDESIKIESVWARDQNGLLLGGPEDGTSLEFEGVVEEMTQITAYAYAGEKGTVKFSS